MTTAQTTSAQTGTPEYRLVPESRKTVAIHKFDGTRYVVTLEAGEPLTCTCLGFRYRRYCKHLRMTAHALEHRDITLPMEEAIVCAGCGVEMPTEEAHTWPTLDGVRFLCAACVDDLLLHAHAEA